MRRKAWATLIATALVTTLFASAAAATEWEFEDIFEQGSTTNVLVVDGAKIFRTGTGVTASVSMPTPEPGTYAVPTTPTSSGIHGSPAAFSLWVFIFFNPEECDGACDQPSDLAIPGVVGAGYNAGGHLVAGPNLTISGRVNEQSQNFGPGVTETIGQALDMGFTIADAEIHVAVAPHGKLDPELLPAQISTPAGNPSFWWVALFK